MCNVCGGLWVLLGCFFIIFLITLSRTISMVIMTVTPVIKYNTLPGQRKRERKTDEKKFHHTSSYQAWLVPHILFAINSSFNEKLACSYDTVLLSLCSFAITTIYKLNIFFLFIDQACNCFHNVITITMMFMLIAL